MNQPTDALTPTASYRRVSAHLCFDREMDIPFILRFHVDDPATGTRRRFSKSVTFKAPHVPRIGERAVIPGTGRTNLGAHQIVDVIYTPSGKVILDFEVEGLLVSSEQQVTVLERAGFTEVADAEVADD